MPKNLSAAQFHPPSPAMPRSLNAPAVSHWEEGLSDEDVVALVSEADITAKRINLGKNKLGPEGARALATALAGNATVTHLDLSYNRLEDSGAMALAEMLDAGASALCKLYLNGASIKHGGAAALADSLRSHTSLTVLGLSDNQIGDRGAGALASALKANGTLCELYLPRNGITDTGVAELAEALKTNTAVHTLLLHEYSGVQEALLREVRSVLQGREEAACRARAMNEETGSWFDVRPRS